MTLLAGVVAVALLLISGLAFAVYFAVADQPTTSAGETVAPLPDSESVRDQIAAAPMLTTSAADATGGTPALGTPPTIDIPLVDEMARRGSRPAIRRLRRVRWGSWGRSWSPS